MKMITTEKSRHNFQISGQRAPMVFEQALGTIKLAAAQANHKLGLINKSDFNAIERATKEFIDGKFSKEFNIDIYQAGAGTSYNMNANELIAGRANQILKKERLHPNNHINMGQSTNDVIPTAIRIAALFSLPQLLSETAKLEKEIDRISKKHKNLLKVGRTHYQDAVPITFGQEFDAYKQAIANSRKFIEQQGQHLQIIGLGGTALGTGITAHPKYGKTVTATLSKLIGIKLSSATNFAETTNNMNVFMNFSASLKSLATNLLNFCGDLKFLNSGPNAGIGEITLPEVQPGSSIMPGKVNPSIAECVEMICLDILGKDKTIELSAQRSQMDLNTTGPIIMVNLLNSMQILTNGISTLRRLALEKLQVNTERITYLYENSLCTATALSPHIGYDATAQVVKDALASGKTIREVVLAKKLLSEKALNEIL